MSRVLNDQEANDQVFLALRLDASDEGVKKQFDYLRSLNQLRLSALQSTIKEKKGCFLEHLQSQRKRIDVIEKAYLARFSASKEEDLTHDKKLWLKLAKDDPEFCEFQQQFEDEHHERSDPRPAAAKSADKDGLRLVP